MNTVENRFIFILSIIYFVGIIGFLTPSLNPLFLKLTPWNLIAAFVVAWVFHKKWEFNHVITLIIIGVLGFFVEMLGVKTGLIFGSYEYGNTFGTKWQGTPYLIGLNWAAMIFYTSSTLVGRIKHPLAIAFIGAGIMTIYDFFLEPIAMRYDFWDWKNNEVPFQNYAAWFVISFVFLWLLHSTSKPIKNKMASALLAIQLVFFIVLYVFNQLL
jgi:bisanhydrobacterioruberin hydratase